MSRQYMNDVMRQAELEAEHERKLANEAKRFVPTSKGPVRKHAHDRPVAQSNDATNGRFFRAFEKGRIDG